MTKQTVSRKRTGVDVVEIPPNKKPNKSVENRRSRFRPALSYFSNKHGELHFCDILGITATA
jgi:hypothetical protein